MNKVRSLAGFFGIMTGVSAVALVLAQAQDLRPIRFTGTLHDFTPSTVSGGPYEMRGEWTLDVSAGVGNFSADMAMETSDYGITGATQVDPANPATRSPHTHHISVTNAKVTYDTSVCPANSPPTTGTGLVVTGAVTTSGNGSPASFESKGASTIQVCIIGGSEVSFSNITLVYTGPATGHFGTQPIHGAVRSVSTK